MSSSAVSNMKLAFSAGTETTLQDLLRGAGAPSGGVLIFTYPKASTPGCTKWASTLNKFEPFFAAANVRILGMSRDSAKANESWRQKLGLKFDLASAANEAMTEIGSLSENSVTRTVCLIEKSGKNDAAIALKISGKSLEAALAEVIEFVLKKNGKNSSNLGEFRQRISDEGGVLNLVKAVIAGRDLIEVSAADTAQSNSPENSDDSTLEQVQEEKIEKSGKTRQTRSKRTQSAPPANRGKKNTAKNSGNHSGKGKANLVTRSRSVTAEKTFEAKPQQGKRGKTAAAEVKKGAKSVKAASEKITTAAVKSSLSKEKTLKTSKTKDEEKASNEKRYEKPGRGKRAPSATVDNQSTQKKGKTATTSKTANIGTTQKNDDSKTKESGPTTTRRGRPPAKKTDAENTKTSKKTAK